MAHHYIVRELEVAGIFGIVPSHGDILQLLRTGERYTMQQLAEQIHRTKPTVTVLVAKLVELGYVSKERAAEDNRITYVRLTEKGLELLPVMARVSQRLNAIVYAGLSNEEAIALETALAKIRDGFIRQQEK